MYISLYWLIFLFNLIFIIINEVKIINTILNGKIIKYFVLDYTVKNKVPVIKETHIDTPALIVT